MPVTASDRSAQHNGSAGHNGAGGSNGTAGGGTPPGGAGPIPHLLTYPGHNRALATIRADVARWFTGHGFSPDTTDRAVLLASELCSNAVEAGPDRPLDLGLALIAGPPLGAVIAVTNTTLGDVPPPSERWVPASPLAPRGRGLAIVDALADHVRVDTSVPGRVTVVAHISN